MSRVVRVWGFSFPAEAWGLRMAPSLHKSFELGVLGFGGQALGECPLGGMYLDFGRFGTIGSKLLVLLARQTSTRTSRLRYFFSSLGYCRRRRELVVLFVTFHRPFSTRAPPLEGFQAFGLKRFRCIQCHSRFRRKASYKALEHALVEVSCGTLC